ncbi:MAG: hypothetical protein AAFV53_35900 [Myxococcota bacterium]
MYPPLCCVGSRQINAPVLQGAFHKISRELGFEAGPEDRGEGGMPAGLWDLGERGSWIYLELLPLLHNAASLTRLLSARLSAQIGLPLEVLLIDQLDDPIKPGEQTEARVAYQRYRAYPDGQRQPLRHPIADRLVGDAGLVGSAEEVTERLLHAAISSQGNRCEPTMWLQHTGAPRHLGLLSLLAETLGQPLRLRRRKTHFELEMTHPEGDNLVHFLSEDDIRYLQTVSPRFARLPVNAS